MIKKVPNSPWDRPEKYPDYGKYFEPKPTPVNPFELLNPFIHSWTVGFDRHFKLMEELRNATKPTYPPYNIKSLTEDKYEIEMAVAGFSKSDITVESIPNHLRVKGSKESNGDNYLHKGLAARDFEQAFVLADYVKVTKVTLIDGILTINLERELPEEKKPKIIPISTK